MKSLANVFDVLWTLSVFVALAASVGGCPWARYCWSAQFLLMGVVFLHLLTVANTVMTKRAKLPAPGG